MALFFVTTLSTLKAAPQPSGNESRHINNLPATTSADALVVDPVRRLGKFEGFGGNFCFKLTNVVTEVVRRRLQPPVARLRMHLDDLHEPPPGCDDQHAAWMRMLLKADRPWSELWQNLSIAEVLYARGTRLQISTWRVPAWILDHPPRHDQNRIAKHHYETLANMVATYLDYLRKRRGVVPETFSFNEPDWGANVIFTPEEYRDALLAVEAALRRHGHSTRLMIGDLSSARADMAYLDPVLSNPTLMSQAAGLSFHAWHEASDQEYAAWRTLAGKLGLPLIIGEIGVDPNWREVHLHGYDYALREMVLYLKVLQQARPKQILYWEYGSSYALLPPDAVAQSYPQSERLALQQHWVKLTPPGSEMIASHNPLSELTVVAFAVPQDKSEGYTLHIGNLGAERMLEVTGLPPHIRRMHVVTTQRGDGFRSQPAMGFKSGSSQILLPALSLTTLTTLDMR